MSSSGGLDAVRPQGLSRRTLAKGAAWTIPAAIVVAAAPAYAISCHDNLICKNYLIDWDQTSNYVRSPATPTMGETTNSGVYTLPLNPAVRRASGANSLLLSVSSTLSGNMKYGVVNSGTFGGDFNENLTITDGIRDPTSVGTTGRGLQLHQYTTTTPRTRNDRQTVTFTFSEQICALSFGIWDIDSVAGDFYDAVEILSGVGFTATRGSGLTGGGVAGNPWYSTNTNFDSATTNAAYSVQVAFNAPVTSFQVIYWNRDGAIPQVDNDQRIMFSDMTVGVREYEC